MITGILFDAVRQNGGSYQMSINNLVVLKKNFIKEKINFIILAHKKHQLLDKLKKSQSFFVSFFTFLNVY